VHRGEVVGAFGKVVTFGPSPFPLPYFTLELATDPELADHSGGYYRSMKHRAKPLEFDAAFSETLWEVATKATATQL
jgi:hypothetical protein